MLDRSTVLVSVHGPDGPGITAGLMDLLETSGAELYDVEQIVVRGRLTLNVLVGLTREHHAIRDLLYYGWERGLSIDFESVDPQPTPVKAMTVVTVLGIALRPADFGAVAGAIAEGGGNIERIFRLSRYPVVSYELAFSNGDVDRIRAGLVSVAAERPFDIAIQPDGLSRRAKRLVVMDVDSTLIENEVIDLLAAEAGCQAEVAALTHRAMSGEIDLVESLHARVALLEGLDEKALDRVSSHIRLTKGARTFIRTLKRMGMTTGIVSAGFDRFTDEIADELGIEYSLANSLEVADGKLTGRLSGEVVDAARKADFLRKVAQREGVPLSQSVAVGDGANDLDMLAGAGLGIAFNAKPVLREVADTAISVPYLDAILFIMGVRRDHVDAADAADPDFPVTALERVEGVPPL